MPSLADRTRVKIPSVLNLGSGKQFLDDALNVDHSPLWRPDIVADLNLPFPLQAGQPCITERFGPVLLERESIDEILAFDVLEHIRELTVAMTSCLHLLRIGGRFRIQVPYELSLGAWSDPTHVRAFNERSWTYYTAWPWYLGWVDARFHLEELDYVLAARGEQLIGQGASLESVLATPRAVDAIKVSLRKQRITPEERRRIEASGYLGAARATPVLA
jgi:SAM-dependent methyltransferase